MQRFLLLASVVVLAYPALAQDSTNPKCKLNADTTVAQARVGLCGFDIGRRQFAGSPSEQARCLLRQVRRADDPNGMIGEANAPARLTDRAGQAVPFNRQHLETYVTQHKIALSDVGLTGASPLSAEYFVIHDTSAPNCSDLPRPNAWCPVVGAFPTQMNSAAWPANSTFINKTAKAHAVTNRVGESIVETPFHIHMSHIKFDYCHNANSKHGLFLGVENIQPRIGSPAIVPPGRHANDRIAPDPGFTDSQYRRLALLYVVASVRRGHWLIPAFHAVIDRQYMEGHDDPQRFDVNRFDEIVATLITEIGEGR